MGIENINQEQEFFATFAEKWLTPEDPHWNEYIIFGKELLEIKEDVTIPDFQRGDIKKATHYYDYELKKHRPLVEVNPDRVNPKQAESIWYHELMHSKDADGELEIDYEAVDKEDPEEYTGNLHRKCLEVIYNKLVLKKLEVQNNPELKGVILYSVMSYLMEMREELSDERYFDKYFGILRDILKSAKYNELTEGSGGR